jgi:hypothetical protein
MAQRTLIVTTDDLTGEQIPGDQVESMEFEFDGARFVIDLSADNADEFRTTMSKWVGAATRVGRAGRGSVTSLGTKRRAGSKTDVSSDTAAIRAWALANGIDVNLRGRIPGEVREQFEKAQSGRHAAAV